MRKKPYFITSLILHSFILLALTLGFERRMPLAVIENTNKQDVISAVVLGDTQKSKIVPQQPVSSLSSQAKPIVKEAPPESKPVPAKAAVALQAEEKKKTQKTAEEEKAHKALLAKKLLEDIQKTHDQQKKLQQKKLQAQAEKKLREQVEKTLRQHLLNEEIKIKGTQSRQAQGEINKYKALILQSISEHWIVPPTANKKLSCELMIRVSPGGTVLDVQITKTSGDPSLDSSARAAVLKSSPLPVPVDPEAFESFRQFVLKVKPENILANSDGPV